MILSCVEIYNTKIRDLIQPSNSDNLKIREDRVIKGFFVEKLTEETVETVQELILFIKRVQLNRCVSATNMNATSSRSHVLLRLKVIQQLLTGETKESVLTFVDLAGSEMCKKTGAEGDTLKEAGYINGSLTTLSRVIEGLGLKGKKGINSHIPFRDSSLTKLLKNALGGNCKTTLVVCVSSECRYKEETLSTLRFATRAACITCQPVVNKVLDAQALYDENIRLKVEIEKLKISSRIGNNYRDDKELFKEKLNELDNKEQEIVELRKQIEELQLKLDKTNEGKIDDNHDYNGIQVRIKEIELQNIKLNQIISDLEIQLMREKKSKDAMQETLVGMQMIASQVASNKNEFCANQELKEILVKHIPELNMDNTDLDDIDPMYTLNICKIVNDKIRNIEIQLQSTMSTQIKSLPFEQKLLDSKVDHNFEKTKVSSQELSQIKNTDFQSQINAYKSRINEYELERTGSESKINELNEEKIKLEDENGNKELEIAKIKEEMEILTMQARTRTNIDIDHNNIINEKCVGIIIDEDHDKGREQKKQDRKTIIESVTKTVNVGTEEEGNLVNDNDNHKINESASSTEKMASLVAVAVVDTQCSI